MPYYYRVIMKYTLLGVLLCGQRTSEFTLPPIPFLAGYCYFYTIYTPLRHAYMCIRVCIRLRVRVLCSSGGAQFGFYGGEAGAVVRVCVAVTVLSFLPL